MTPYIRIRSDREIQQGKLRKEHRTERKLGVEQGNPRGYLLPHNTLYHGKQTLVATLEHHPHLIYGHPVDERTVRDATELSVLSQFF